MTASEGQDELTELSEIYDVLRHDAKTIIHDLHRGVVMWREAAAANVAAAGFLLILALTIFQSSRPGNPTEGAIIIVAEMVLAMVLLGFALVGFRKYFQLRRKYAGLFERAKKIE